VQDVNIKQTAETSALHAPQSFSAHFQFTHSYDGDPAAVFVATQYCVLAQLIPHLAVVHELSSTLMSTPAA